MERLGAMNAETFFSWFFFYRNPSCVCTISEWVQRKFLLLHGVCIILCFYSNVSPVYASGIAVVATACCVRLSVSFGFL